MTQVLTVTKYAGTITQTTGSDKVSWSNLNNLKNANNTYGKTGKIGSKTDTKKTPASLTFSNFGFDLPKGAEVRKVIVGYAHQKLDDEQYDYPSIAGPTITLRNTGITPIDFVQSTGVAPTKTLAEKNKVFDKSYSVSTITSSGMIGQSVRKENVYEFPPRTTFNRTAFGVTVAYPSNTSSNKGYLQLKYVRITIHYIVPSYTMKISKLGSNDDLVQDIVNFKVDVSNVNLARYQPDFQITLPSDCTVVTRGGDVGNTSITGNILIWSPTGMHTAESYAETADGSWTLNLGLVFQNDGTKNFTITDLLNNTYSELTGVPIYPIPTSIEGTTDLVDKERIVYAKQNTAFNVILELSKDYLIQEGINNVYLFSNKAINWAGTSLTADTAYAIPLSNFNDEGKYVTTFTSALTGETLLYLSTTNSKPANPYIQVKVIPSDYTYPEITVLKLDDEELARLGDGYSYDVIVDAMLITANVSYIEDHYRNYRIGVTNSIAETDNLQAIFNACQSWSTMNTVINSYEELSADFVYDEDYPVYIVVTGDYHEFENYPFTSFRFSTPNIVAKDTEYVKEYCVFPYPIQNIVDDNIESIGSMTIEPYSSSNTIILYKFPFENDFGTNSQFAVRGLNVELDCDVTAQLVANATIRNAHGVVGQESILLTPGQNSYIIGADFDTWGFKISEITDLNKFEIELGFSNITEGIDVNIDISDIRFGIRYLRLENALKEQVYVDDENLEWYGAFIREFEVPFGAKTDTKYLNVTGTDINDSYLMTIKEKEIKIKFDIDGCNLEESTELLKQITRLFTNKRDELNRPIPKQIRSTFNPDEYYEFILEDAITAEMEMSGYTCEVKLTIPAGTSFKINDTVTNVSGVVNSIAKVNPYIIVVPQSDSIELVEEYSDQKLNLGYEGMTGKFVELDCEHQIAWLRDDEDSDPVNISSMVDYNADWFSLEGQYNFIPTNCVVQTVSFSERGG